MTQHLGKYEIQRELGRGAFGTVYLARDTVLDVPRALKVLHPALVMDGTVVERFHREARLAARLEHPHIVPVYDFGQAEGHFYLAMRYMEGGSLKEHLAQGPLPWDEVMRIVQEVAAGLAYAHAQGVVHRDLKPGNILFDAQGRAAVTDFGLAKALRGAGDSASLTMSGGLIGTPAYMAPELWQGKPATPATDQYALACMVYEMVIGKALFGGDTPWEVMERHKEGPRFPERWPEGVPAGLEEVLRKALAQDPERRYPDVRTFARALSGLGKKRYLDSETSAEVLVLGEVLGEDWEKALLGMERNLPTMPRVTPSPSHLSSKQERGLGRGRKRGGRSVLLTAGLRLVVGLTVLLVIGGLLSLGGQWINSTLFERLALAGTPYPTPDVSTTTTNVEQLVPLARWDVENDVYSVVFSPDGRLLASGVGYTARVWRVADGELQRIMKGHEGPVYGAAFSPDGTLLASGSSDHTVRLWRVSDGVLLRDLEGHGSAVYGVVFSPDGTLLASGSGDGTVRVWRTSDGELLRILRGNTSGISIFSVAFSPDGTLLASGAEDGSIYLWRVSDGTLYRTLTAHMSAVTDLAFSPDGRLLASGAWDNTARLWLVASGEVLHSLKATKGDRSGPVYVSFSPDGKLLASGSGAWRDKTVRMWQVSDGAMLRSFRSADVVHGIAFSPDGRLLALGLEDNTIRLWGVQP